MFIITYDKSDCKHLTVTEKKSIFFQVVGMIRRKILIKRYVRASRRGFQYRFQLI